MNLAPVVHLMGKHYLQLEFLLIKTVWECCIFQLCNFSTMDLFFSQISVQTNQILSRQNCSPVPATCQVPTLGCPHQKTNQMVLCGIRHHLLYTVGQTFPWLSMGSQALLKEKNIKEGRIASKAFGVTAAIPVLFHSRNPPQSCVD